MPTSKTVGLDWTDVGDTAPEEGVELHHEHLKTVLNDRRQVPQRVGAAWDVQLTKEEGQQLGLESVTSNTYIKVGNRYFTPAPDRGEVQWAQRKFLGCTPDTCARVGCQKCMFGVVMDDDEGVLHYFRFSVWYTPWRYGRWRSCNTDPAIRCEAVDPGERSSRE
jgi:hypothetical protein